MSARLACYTIALAAFASLAASSPARATEICDQQFNQCINKGTPTYKCQELRELCESQYNVRPQKLVAVPAHQAAWTSNAVDRSKTQLVTPAAP